MRPTHPGKQGSGTLRPELTGWMKIMHRQKWSTRHPVELLVSFRRLRATAWRHHGSGCCRVARFRAGLRCLRERGARVHMDTWSGTLSDLLQALPYFLFKLSAFIPDVFIVRRAKRMQLLLSRHRALFSSPSPRPAHAPRSCPRTARCGMRLECKVPACQT